MISSVRDPYLSLRDSLVSLLRPSARKEEFWALKDVSFNVEAGDTLGVVGRNGAGKSTLLKILSRITFPTTGKVLVRGRIASLLEVGTGFHPELTGRENVFLNGSILGMRRGAIRKNFDAIVDFAGVGKFVDTPLKFFSSGMQLRLAFAVAAFLDNEVLVIDEVLAVGDAEFQRKCIGKMESVAKTGRTVIFVSHNAAALKSLCKKGVLLEHGKLAHEGTIGEVLDIYHSNTPVSQVGEIDFSGKTQFANEHIRLLSLSVFPLHGDILSVSSGIGFRLHFYNYNPNISLDATFELRNDEDLVIFHSGALVSSNNDSRIGTYVVEFRLDAYTLNSDSYYLNLIFGLNQREPLFVCDRCYGFRLVNDVASGSNFNELPGILRPKIDFKVSLNES